MTTPIQTYSLSKTVSDADYALYLAALEWDLIEPIVIEDRSDLKSEHKWHDRVQPYNHQVTNLLTFCRRLPVTLLADDVGLGKTISAGLIMSELISRKRLHKALIVCPKLLIPQWIEELDSKFGIKSKQAIGGELATADIEGVGAIVTTYHSAREHLQKIKKNGFDMLILDEAHKLRNLYGVDKPPKVAIKFREALEEQAFPYVLMLTATPIQNRLWDIYSLIDLLTIARGHKNPLGSPGMFARKFIADDKNEARKLRLESQEEFRSVVYGYMSRVRRGDANLQFPDRIVQMHIVEPSDEELELFKIVTEHIQNLNRLSQIGILEALVSNPHTLLLRLERMANNGTVPLELASSVKAVVQKMTVFAKLNGLEVLIDKLRSDNPQKWRVIIFTRWLETQTSIQIFLETKGIRCGLINGSTTSKNQGTLESFKKDTPEINVIISTEAGSEGINLQIANVLVNFDLPWNPMIVEQRIGRIQRLASGHANVCIFNIVLKDTFEQHIVGRLMEKLQMAAHAIGDIESLLEASGLEDGPDEITGFEEKIRLLVLSSLKGINVEEATKKTELSIDLAKINLKQEQANINNMLGKTSSSLYDGPRCPKLKTPNKKMNYQDFIIAGLSKNGTDIYKNAQGQHIAELNGAKYLIPEHESTDDTNEQIKVISIGSHEFNRLIKSLTTIYQHQVQDMDFNLKQSSAKLISTWLDSYGATLEDEKVTECTTFFKGTSSVMVRITVAHDSYEQLINVECDPLSHFRKDSSITDTLGASINPDNIGLNFTKIAIQVMNDNNVSEFCRFYKERRDIELQSAGDDPRKIKRIEDQFSPRVDMKLVGLSGIIYRIISVRVSYNLDKDETYSSILKILPYKDEIIEHPDSANCSLTDRVVPIDCLGACAVTHKLFLKHLLLTSEVTGKMALPEYIVTCSYTNKKALHEETSLSSITGKLVITSELKKSAISGKLGEPNLMDKCEFTHIDVLPDEVRISEVSGKKYRIDQGMCSIISLKKGHQSEFIMCSVTKKPLLLLEAQTCEITGSSVAPGILERCEMSGKLVLPSELDKSSVSGRKALKTLFTLSSLSDARLLSDEMVKSVSGKCCALIEARKCAWSNEMHHPEDLKQCSMTKLQVHFRFLTQKAPLKLEVLYNLLVGISRRSDMIEIWGDISPKIAILTKVRKCFVESSELSPDGKKLAVCAVIKSVLGLKSRYCGAIYSIEDKQIVGRIAISKRAKINRN